MKRVSALFAGLLILLGGATACGSSNTASKASNNMHHAVTGGNSGTSGVSTAACAQAGTRKFAKTRALTDLGLSYGAFHRYILKPARSGSFRKGASGRTRSLIKAGVAAAAIAKLLSNARKNLAADPRLCKYVPTIDGLKSSMGGVKGLLTGGAGAASLGGLAGKFDMLKGGTGFKVPGNVSLPGLS